MLISRSSAARYGAAATRSRARRVGDGEDSEGGDDGGGDDGGGLARGGRSVVEGARDEPVPAEYHRPQRDDHEQEDPQSGRKLGQLAELVRVRVRGAAATALPLQLE